MTSDDPDPPPYYFGPPPTQPPPPPPPVGEPLAPSYPAQPYPGQPYPGQAYPGQPYPGQAYPGQPYPGQPYPGQPYPGQPYPGQPYPGPPYPGPPHWGPPPGRPGPVGSPGRLRAHRVWATLAQVLIVAAIVVQVAVLQALSAELSLARRVIADPQAFGDSIEGVQHDYDRVRTLSAVLIVLLLLAGAFFIVWLYRLRADVDAFAPFQGGLSRGWAIGGWFIPLANAVLPFLVVRDVIRAAVTSAARPRVYVVAGLWWGLWILGGVGARLVSVPADASLGELEHAFGQMQLWTVFEGIAAVLAVAVVEILTRADRRRWTTAG